MQRVVNPPSFLSSIQLIQNLLWQTRVKEDKGSDKENTGDAGHGDKLHNRGGRWSICVLRLLFGVDCNSQLWLLFEVHHDSWRCFWTFSSESVASMCRLVWEMSPFLWQGPRNARYHAHNHAVGTLEYGYLKSASLPTVPLVRQSLLVH